MTMIAPLTIAFLLSHIPAAAALLPTHKMVVDAAWAAVGGLSKPSKMPGYAISTPASACNVGSRLRKVAGSVCASCYAHKGRYVMPNVAKALERRLDALPTDEHDHPAWEAWVANMVTLVKHFCGDGALPVPAKGSRSPRRKVVPFFRWHDSGDIQSVAHLNAILEVARRTPEVKHWIPTREVKVVRSINPAHIPTNLIIRISAMSVGKPAPRLPGKQIQTSTVGVESVTRRQCMAYTRGGVCGRCRKCWSTKVGNVNYPLH